jgi:hypothetical protein
VFIYVLVPQVDLGARRNDEREPNPFLAWPAVLEENRPDTCQDEFTDRFVCDRRFFFELAVQGRGNIHRGTDRILLHAAIIAGVP